MPPPVSRSQPAEPVRHVRSEEAAHDYRTKLSAVEEYHGGKWVVRGKENSGWMNGVSRPLPFRLLPSQSAHADPGRFLGGTRHGIPYPTQWTRAAEYPRTHPPVSASDDSLQNLHGRLDERTSNDRRSRRPQKRHYDTDYGASSTQPHATGMQVIRVPPSSQAYSMPPSRSSNGSPSPHRRANDDLTSAASPFFRRDALSRPAPPRPTRGSMAGSAFRSPNRLIFTTHGAEAAYSSASTRQLTRTSLNGLSFIEEPYRSTQHQRLLPSSRAKPPPSPDAAQGPSHPFDRPSVPASANYDKLQATAYNGRISLPPASRSPARYRGKQEQTLTRIPGIRGVSSQGARTGKHQYGPLYQPGRALFSSVGGRRSVRR